MQEEASHPLLIRLRQPAENFVGTGCHRAPYAADRLVRSVQHAAACAIPPELHDHELEQREGSGLVADVVQDALHKPRLELESNLTRRLRHGALGLLGRHRAQVDLRTL